MQMRNKDNNRAAVEDIKVDLKASNIKPLHANWLINVISSLSQNTSVLKAAFEKPGILNMTEWT